MKLTLETYGKIYSVETPYDDITADDYIELFSGLLLSATFPQCAINSAIIDLSDQIKSELE